MKGLPVEGLRLTGQINRRPRWRLAPRRPRGDEGNLVLTVVLLFVVVALAATTLSAILGGVPTALQSQSGAYVVAQARAGVSDALFRLDQMGDNPVDFCVGDPPASALPGDLTPASCAPSGPTPLPSVPALRYYVVDALSAPTQAGVTDEFQLVVHTSSSGQSRNADAVLYREADDFGFFGVSGFTTHGALKQATVAVVGNGGQPSQGNVYLGVGPGATASCSGNDSNTHISTVGEHGANVSSCPQPVQQSNQLEPASPAVCAPGQSSQAFAPCVDTASFAASNGVSYCPLPGSGIANTLSPGSSLAPPPPQATSSASQPVFDCATGGAAVTITTGDPLPFGLSDIPPGSYYLDSNAVTIGEIDPKYLDGPVNLYILPQGCTPTSCPAPSENSACPVSSSPSLSLTADNNVASGATPPPGEPSDWNVYFEGSDFSPSNKIWFDGTLYAPDASLISNGANGLKLYGALVLNCWTINGSPNLTFAYPFHTRQYIVNWSVTDFRISS